MALRDQHCQPLPKGSPPLEATRVRQLLEEVAGWKVNDDHTAIQREFKFKNYYETIAFVNALAWIANQQDHHPDLEVSYNRCAVTFSTHSIGGLSNNDFICAARVNALLETA